MTLASGGELRNIDFQVRSSPTVRVSGRISGEVDLATRTAIRLEPADAALISPVTAFETAVATAGADGQFRFDGVVPGSYNLRVLTDPPPDLKQLPRGATMFGGPGIAQSISMPDGTIAPVPLPAEPMRWAILPIVVSDKEIRNLELIVQKGIRLTGKVQFESGSVSIGNVNLQQIELSIESARDTSGGTSSVRGTADKAGVLRSSSLPQGDYYVRTSSLPPGLGLKSVLLGSKDIIEGIVNLDRDRDDLTLILTDRPTRIVGTVVRVNGTPDPDATVVIFPVDQRLWVDYGLHPGRLRAERAAPNGAFQIEGMPIGKYLVAATYESAMEDWRDQTTLSRLSSGAAKVQVDDGGVVRVMLSSKGR